jgi:hypothetical protein
MWQTRQDLLRAVSVTFLAISLGACFTILIFSWPERRSGTAVAAPEQPAVVRGPAIAGAEIVPAALETGKIQKASATAAPQ